VTRTRKVVAIPGEDAAPEAFHPTVALIDGMKLPIEWVFPPVGLQAIETHGKAFPSEARAAIDASDATLFGATSGPSGGALFYLRWGKQTFANVRPTRWFPGCHSPLARPEGLDLVIVRENLEDLYIVAEGDLAQLAPAAVISASHRKPVSELGPGKFAIKAITEKGAEQVLRFSFELARKRKALGKPGKLATGTKHNMLPKTDGLFRDTASRLSADYPDVTFEPLLADDLAHRLVARGHDFDVIVLPNMYGDILSDAAAALAGGLGLAASGCYGDSYAYFESAHGTAPDIAGKGTINPTATILSAALMLDYLAFTDASRALVQAVESVYAKGSVLTTDQGGDATTERFCAAVAAEL